MTSGLFTTSASGSLPPRLTGVPGAPAATFLASGMPIGGAITLFLIIALIALVLVIVLGVWMWRSPGSARAQRIKEAAAADVAAIEEDDKFVRPDAPGRQEDEL